MLLSPAEAVVMRAVAAAMAPPPAPDLNAWAAAHLEFDEASPFPGPYSPARFPFFAAILDALGPEHPAREVTLRGSAQFGKTETIHQVTLGGWFDLHPRNALVVHPTTASATEWVRSKWMRMRRANPRLRAVFGAGAAQVDSLSYQETLDRSASLKVVSAGSPSDLSGTTRPLVLMDDVSKFETTPMGDPEQLAVSRASAFDEAKILRTSTPMIRGACRITAAYERGIAQEWAVPCPMCGHKAPLRWEDFKPSITPEAPEAAHFTCRSCGGVIEHKHKTAMVAAGEWVANNPRGDHPSFHLWRAYMPHRDWASIAVEWLQAEGDAGREQTFFNDVLGLPYEQASDAPDWTALRDRTENAAPEEQTPRSRIPALRPLLTAGADCQGDRIEVHVVAHGRDARAHAVDVIVIPHHIGTDEGRSALDAVLKRRWRNAAGRDVALDRLCIDGGTYTDDVWGWSKGHPWNRVNIVKGASTANGPIYAPQKFERKKDGKALKRQKRAYLVNVSALKATFYADLKKEDPDARGFCSFALGLGDAYYRQLSAEKRVLRRNRHGVMESRWELVEPGGRNEALDTWIYADVAARLCGSRSMTDAEWDALEAERDAPPEGPQGDLFDAPLAPPARPATAAKASRPSPTPTATDDPTGVRAAFARLSRS